MVPCYVYGKFYNNNFHHYERPRVPDDPAFNQNYDRNNYLVLGQAGKAREINDEDRYSCTIGNFFLHTGKMFLLWLFVAFFYSAIATAAKIEKVMIKNKSLYTVYILLLFVCLSYFCMYEIFFTALTTPLFLIAIVYPPFSDEWLFRILDVLFNTDSNLENHNN